MMFFSFVDLALLFGIFLGERGATILRAVVSQWTPRPVPFLNRHAAPIFSSTFALAVEVVNGVPQIALRVQISVLHVIPVTLVRSVERGEPFCWWSDCNDKKRTTVASMCVR